MSLYVSVSVSSCLTLSVAAASYVLLTSLLSASFTNLGWRKRRAPRLTPEDGITSRSGESLEFPLSGDLSLAELTGLAYVCSCKDSRDEAAGRAAQHRARQPNNSLSTGVRQLNSTIYQVYQDVGLAWLEIVEVGGDL